MAEYRAGVCNIGPDEQRKRFHAGLASLAAAVGFTAWVLATGRPVVYFAGTFALLTGGFLGYLQARMEFCVAFGALARYDLSGSDGDSGTVTQAALRRKDRMRALELLAYSAGLAGAVTLLVYAVQGFVAV
jgi:hypothetical protein